MESNNIVAAPEIYGVNKLFEIWKCDHLGSIDEFYRFMTTPTSEREFFISSLNQDVAYVFTRGVTEVILRK